MIGLSLTQFFLINCLAILGIKATVGDGDIFGALAREIRARASKHSELGDKLTKPIFGCLYCMSSFWSIVYLLLFSSLCSELRSLQAQIGPHIYLVYILAVCGALKLVSIWWDSTQRSNFGE